MSAGCTPNTPFTGIGADPAASDKWYTQSTEPFEKIRELEAMTVLRQNGSSEYLILEQYEECSQGGPDCGDEFTCARLF